MSNNFHLQLYRGTTTQNDAYTGLSGEVTVDTTLSKLRLHDGSTKGGVEIGGMPVGSIIPYAGTTIPAGYLLCDGSAISRTTYSALFASIGTTYGEGDGNSTFNLPTSRRVITETYSSETDWYRVWSDGWCEQGGVQIGNGNYGLIVINLLKNYRDTNYSIYASIIWGDTSEWYTGTFTPDAKALTDIAGPSTKMTAFSFQIQGFSSHRWYTCGYISNYIPLNDIIKY